MYSQFYFSPTREAFRDKIRVRKFIHIMIIMIYRRQIYLRGGRGGGGVVDKTLPPSNISLR